MKEKNNELINNLLQSKFNWWNRFWGQLTKIVKVKSKDSSYQECLDSIRKDVVKKNSEEDSEEDTTYQVYIDLVNEYLKTNGKRLLTDKEEEIVIAHLEVVAIGYCNAGYKDLGITQLLSIETAKKVCEIHPDYHYPTQEQVEQREVEVLAIQNFLYDNDAGCERKGRNEK